MTEISAVIASHASLSPYAALPLSFDDSFFYPILHACTKESAGLLSDNWLLYREVVRAL